MPYRLVQHVLACLIAAFASVTAAQPAQSAAAAPSDPAAVLARAKSASGGATWDRFTSQHSRVRIFSGGRTASAERWVDIVRGRSYLKFQVGDATGEQGFDGRRAWTRDGNDAPRAEISSVDRELAVNAAYRDKLAFWFPDRGRARIEFKEHATFGVNGYDVVRITPEGGRPFEFWVNSDTGLIDRMVEPEAVETRTESYDDFRDVQGVKVPFRVRSTRSKDPSTDEIVTVQLIEYDVPLDGIPFSPVGLASPDYRFPEGKASVSVPFEVHNGHLYFRVRMDGKGPYVLLFAPGGINIVVPDVARALASPASGDAPATLPSSVDVASLDIGGLLIKRPRFTVAPLQAMARRAEGVAMEGVMGLELLRHFPVRIDYAASTLTFYDPDLFRYDGKAAPLPLEALGAMPLVKGSIAGIEGLFGLDVGGTASVVLAKPFWSANRLDEKLRAGAEAVVGTGPSGAAKALLARASTLEIAGTTVKGPVTLLSTATEGLYAQQGLAGTLGYGVLRRFGIVLDVPHDQIYLEPNAALADADVFDRSGLWLEPSAKGFEVADAITGAPAAKAGLKAGDVIVAINGQPATAMSLTSAREQLRAAPGTRVRVKLAGGREATITLADLI